MTDQRPLWWKLRPLARVAGAILLVGAVLLIARFAGLLLGAYQGHPVLKG